MSDDDELASLLDDLEAAERAASPGPWRVQIAGHEHAEVKLTPRGQLALLAWGPNTAADARFIVLARNAIPRLIAALRPSSEQVGP